MKDVFELVSDYKPTGDQPQAIEGLVKGLQAGDREQILLGVTGSGKTFTMANVIAKMNRPTLVLAHNKTLAAQLCFGVSGVFSQQRGGVFCLLLRLLPAGGLHSRTRTPILKRTPPSTTRSTSCATRATCALSERRDVIIVASVSCIYSLGDPIDYRNMVISLRPGHGEGPGRAAQKAGGNLQYERNDINFIRNKFRVRGDVVEIFPAYSSGHGYPGGVFRRRDRPASARSTPSPGRLKSVAEPRGHLSRPPTTLCPRRRWTRPSQEIEQEMERAGGVFQGRGQAHGGPAHRPAHHATTWRCCRRSASARALRTTPGYSPAGRRAAPLTP